MNNSLIVLSGPTGVGKTDLSLDIAHHFNSEIISCDSRQFYSEMKIGTAVPDVQQLQKIKHHFIRFISINAYYSVSLFENDVMNLLPLLFSKNGIALMTGGSCLYIDAVCNSIDDIPDVPAEIREKYQNMNSPVESLRIALRIMDPDYYAKADLKNPKRIIRALEICEATGRPYSSFLTNQKKARDFNVIKIGLNRPRENLYDRINSRVDNMIKMGLEAEARSLSGMRHLNALKCVGYKEFFDYFDGKISYEECIRLIKRNSRRYAKRQLTWWSKDREITWFHPDQKKEIFDFISKSIRVK